MLTLSSYICDAWNRREHASKHEAAFSVVGRAAMMLSPKGMEESLGWRKRMTTSRDRERETRAAG